MPGRPFTVHTSRYKALRGNGARRRCARCGSRYVIARRRGVHYWRRAEKTGGEAACSLMGVGQSMRMVYGILLSYLPFKDIRTPQKLFGKAPRGQGFCSGFSPALLAVRLALSPFPESGASVLSVHVTCEPLALPSSGPPLPRLAGGSRDWPLGASLMPC